MCVKKGNITQLEGSLIHILKEKNKDPKDASRQIQLELAGLHASGLVESELNPDVLQVAQLVTAS